MLLSAKECEYVKSFWDLQKEDHSRYGTIHLTKDLQITTYAKVNASKVRTSNKDLLNFLIKKFSSIGIKSISYNRVSLHKYIEGGYFSKHRDIYTNGGGSTTSTLIIQLSDPSEYEGGDFLIEGVAQDRGLGTFSLFNGRREHEVTKITKGTRFSLTVFLTFEDFYNNSKSII
jgi:PKHD-type hydroxylase